MTTHRPLPRIDALPEDQRQELAEWLLSGVTFAKIAELLKEKFDVEIPRTNLHRFKTRCEILACVDDTPESSAARAELINAAATGKTNFSTATVRVLERQQFELALDHNDPDRHKALGDVTGWLHKHKTDAVRERMAAVQEGKLKLRQLQFDQSNNGDTDAKIRDLNQKIADAFDQHPVLTAIEKGSAGLAREGSSQLAVQTSPPAGPFSKTETAPVPPKNKKGEPALLSETLSQTLSSSSVPLVAPNHSDGGSSAKSAASTFDQDMPATTSSIHSSTSPLAVNPKSLESTVDSYTTGRAHEYWTWRRAAEALPHGQLPPPYITEHRYCPCGKPSPCPDHEDETYGEFPSFFWSTSPHLRAYEICLTARHLPYRDPSECVPQEFRIYPRKRDYYD
jgi:hypothetical protein